MLGMPWLSRACAANCPALPTPTTPDPSCAGVKWLAICDAQLSPSAICGPRTSCRTGQGISPN